MRTLYAQIYAELALLVAMLVIYFLVLEHRHSLRPPGPLRPTPTTVTLRQDARINILRRGDFVLATYSDVTDSAGLCYAGSTHHIECGRAIQPPTIGELSWPGTE